ncbi:MAG TPA: FHA domain-containing protein [Drouetiella sp.]
MESICPVCKKPYDGVVCTQCTVTDLDMGGLMAGEGLQLKSEDEAGNQAATAFLVDLVSNRKIPITTPRCKVGRDDLNDIVISGDQSISRFHFVITKEGSQYLVQDGKSRHGTFLNGNQITAPEPIHDGDVLKVGVSLFWFVIEQAVQSVGAEKFAPVDVDSIEPQELEFELPEPSNTEGTREMGIPAAAQVHIAPKGETPKNPNAGEITVAMLLDPLQQKELNDAIEKAAQSKKDAEEVDSKATASTGTESKSGDSKAAESPAAKHDEGTPSDAVASDKQNFTDFGDKFSEVKQFGDYTYGINDLFDPLKNVASEISVARANEEFAPPEDHLTDLENTTLESLMEESLLDSEPIDAYVDDVLPIHDTHEEPVSKSHDKEIDAKPEVVSKAAEEAPKSEQKREPAKSVELPSFIKESKSVVEANAVEELLAASASAASSNEPESPASSDASHSPAASIEPATSSCEPEAVSAEVEHKHDESAKDQEATTPEATTPTTLDKFAEIIGEVSGNTEKKVEEPAPSLKLNFQEKVEESKSPQRVEAFGSNGESQSSNGAKGMSIVKEAGSSAVPEWCKKYFSSELNSLSKELTELNEQVRLAQQKIKEVEGRVALTKGLRNTLLTAQGEELVEACGKVLTMLGWRVKISEEDKHELRLDINEDKNVSIARIVWTETQADRTHLGQLSISQTRYWCEQGVEPKGILIVCKGGDNAPSPLGAGDFNSELAEYASKKNVCLMTTLQLLSVYKEIALHDGSPETVRSTILASSGWLQGFNLEPGTESAEKEEGTGTNKLSSLLSA